MLFWRKRDSRGTGDLSELLRSLNHLEPEIYKGRKLKYRKKHLGKLIGLLQEIINDYVASTNGVKDDLLRGVFDFVHANIDLVYNGVNRSRGYSDAYKEQLENYLIRFQGVGAVHLELGTWTAFPNSRVSEIKEADGLKEFIRLDFNADFYPDVIADCMVLPFKDQVIDVVQSNSLFEHIAYPHKVVEESFRVLRPGGMMRVIVPFIFNLHGCPHDYLRYTPEFFEQVCKDAGFAFVMAESYFAGGLYYTLHQCSKAAIVEGGKKIQGKEAAAQTMHTLLMLLLFILSPFDRYFQGEGRQWFHSVECFAIKPGDFCPQDKNKRL